MLMLDHARSITREALRGIQTPAPTASWRPAPHADVVDVLTARAAVRGLKITSERFAVLSGALYPEAGRKIEVPDAKLFGSMDFAPVPDMAFPAGCAPSAGFRNSHDQSFSLSILSGARVFVCANGVLSAEHIVSRKHTSGLDLEESIDMALEEFMVSLGEFNGKFQRLVARSLTDIQAHHEVVELARAGAFASSDILPVIRGYENPVHEEFRPRNAWSLYNAATARMKTQSPSRQVEGFKALNMVMLDARN